MEDEPVLTVDEVAQRLRLSPVTVRRWLRAGKLRGVRLGQTKAGWRVRLSEVQALLEDATQLPLPEERGREKAAA